MKKLVYIIIAYVLFRTSFNFLRSYFEILDSYGGYLSGFDTWKTQGIYVIIILIIIFSFYPSKKILFKNIKIHNLKDFVVLFPFLGAVLIFITACIGFYEVSLTYDINTLYLPITLLSCILIGIHEETFFRGIVFDELSKKTKLLRAILISASLFGISHISNFFLGQDIGATLHQIMYAFFLGILYAMLFYYTKNLILLIFLHCIHDFSLKLSDYMFHFIGENDTLLFPFLLQIFNFVFLGLLSVIILSIIIFRKIKKINA